VVLRLLSLGRHSAPRRRREVRAERPGVPAGQAAEAWARQPPALQLREVHRQAASFRQPAAHPEAAQRAVAVRPQVLLSVQHQRREVSAVRRDAAAALSVPRRQASSPQALRLEGQRLPGPLSKARLLARASHPVLPAAWRHPAARPSDACRSERVLWSAQPASQASLLPPEAVSESRWGVPSASVAAAVQQRAAAALESGAAAVPQQEVAAQVLDAAAVQQRVAAVAAAWDAGAEPQRAVAAAVLDAAEVPQQVAARAAVSDAEAVPQPAVARVAESDAAVPQLAVQAESVASPPAAARPSVAPWVFRRGRALPWPARRPAARSAHAKRMSQAASRSEQSWQAARGEGLS